MRGKTERSYSINDLLLQLSASFSVDILAVLRYTSEVSKGKESVSYSGQLWSVFELEACVCVDTFVRNSINVCGCSIIGKTGKKQVNSLVGGRLFSVAVAVL